MILLILIIGYIAAVIYNHHQPLKFRILKNIKGQYQLQAHSRYGPWWVSSLLVESSGNIVINGEIRDIRWYTIDEIETILTKYKVFINNKFNEETIMKVIDPSDILDG